MVGVYRLRENQRQEDKIHVGSNQKEGQGDQPKGKVGRTPQRLTPRGRDTLHPKQGKNGQNKQIRGVTLKEHLQSLRGKLQIQNIVREGQELFECKAEGGVVSQGEVGGKGEAF